MNTSIPATEITRSRAHFEILDGLRGVAAVSVVVFHFMEVAYPDAATNFIGHGFLAVDFFFCLSGFVIAYAYDQRIAEMGTWEFFKARLIRLHPLVIFGSVLGLLAFFFDPFGGHPELLTAGQTALVFLCSVLMIPYPVMDDRAQNLFGLNAPSWSLFWEYIANIFYAVILYRLQKHILLLMAVLAAGLLTFVAYRSGNLLGGWTGSNFWDGGARIFYSFLAGMLIYRYNWIIRSKLGFGALSLLLLLAFVFPSSPATNFITEPFVVILYFPLLVSLGAGAVLSPKMHKLCVFSGNISYPLYMTHYGVIWMFANYYTASKPDSSNLTLIIITGLALLISFAYLTMVGYDIPFRRYLDGFRKANLAKKQRTGQL